MSQRIVLYTSDALGGCWSFGPNDDNIPRFRREPGFRMIQREFDSPKEAIKYADENGLTLHHGIRRSSHE